MAPAVLSFQAVAKTYAYSHLGRTTYTRGVEELTLEIGQGEAFGLLGLNGSGKTTTFKLALGLLRPTKGAVRVLGHDPAGGRADGRIGYLPELPYFYPFLTPVESLRFYGQLSGLAAAALEEKISRALREVGLEQASGRRIGQLSKGLTQRVGLAQAILHDPQLIILDEPVSGLDPLAIKQFRESLVRLKGQGRTLLVSSHSISEIERLCDRVGILKEGRMTRIAAQAEWARTDGGLEGLFVETVK